MWCQQSKALVNLFAGTAGIDSLCYAIPIYISKAENFFGFEILLVLSLTLSMCRKTGNYHETDVKLSVFLDASGKTHYKY